MVLEVNRVNIVLHHSRLDRVQTPSQAEARHRDRWTVRACIARRRFPVTALDRRFSACLRLLKVDYSANREPALCVGRR
jgi:hypothetical protein